MKLTGMYSFVVLVWSTTPLAIKWSNSSLSFIAAVSLRMLISLVLCALVLRVMRKPLVVVKKDWVVFFAASLGFYPTMILVYWSAQFIPSGLISVIFGLFPFFVGLFSLFILNQNIFTFQRIISLFIAIGGLMIINIEQIMEGDTAILGVLGTLVAVLLFGLNSVWLKYVGADVEPIRQITGALLISTPLFLLTWLFMDGEVPLTIDFKSIIGVGYLSIAGSLLSHTAYFYIVRSCSVSTVGMITLIAPVIAMAISIWVVGEKFSHATVVGALLVILSLAIYQGAFGYLSHIRFGLFKIYRLVRG